MTMPNFIIIGAAKSGTTALYKYLQQHPDIFMSEVKEPRFFAFEGDTLTFKGPQDHGTRFNAETITDLTTYQRLFDDVQNESAIGEASPAYLSSAEKASARIQHHVPQAKLIAILRQPAERAYSGFMHTVRNGWEQNLNFDQVLQQEQQRIQDHWGALWQHQTLGFYSQQLTHYYGRFPQEHIRVYLYDDLKKDAQGLMRDIFDFLEVDATFEPDMSKKVNVSGITRSQWLRKFLNRPDPIKNVLKPLLPKRFRKSLVQKAKSGNLVRPTISPEIRHQLTQVYRDDILMLQDLIDRDLSTWLS